MPNNFPTLLRNIHERSRPPDEVSVVTPPGDNPSVAAFAARLRSAGWAVREISTAWTQGKLWTLYCTRGNGAFFVEGNERRELWAQAWDESQTHADF